MADNITVKDASGSSVVLRAKDNSSVFLPYFRASDGTNLQPIGDAAARSIYVTVTDQTNTMPTGDAQARAIQVQVGDGTNTLPAGDTNARQIYTTPVGNTANGLSKYKIADLAGTAQEIKSSAGTVYAIYITNEDGVDAYIGLFDVANGGITPGSTVPDFEFLVETADGSNQMNVPIPPQGLPFGTAINIISVTASAGGTGSGTGVNVHVVYK